MIDFPHFVPLGRRLLAAAPLGLALSACATAGVSRPVASSERGEAQPEQGPQVRIWTAEDDGALSRVRPVVRLDDDAYVVVVNVGLDGYARVVFPESPDDDGFLRGGRTYRLPSFFPGFAGHHRSQYGRLYNATSAYDDVYDRYAGYVFVIASWRPMHFELGEAMGFWDDVRLAAHERQLDPYVVMHRFADDLVPGRMRDYTARFARYKAFPGTYAGRPTFASCAARVSTFGFVPWGFQGFGVGWWTPFYGLGYYSGAGGCGYGYGFGSLRARRPPIIVVHPPARPTPATPGDPATASPRARPEREPVAVGDGSQRKPGRQPRGKVDVGEEPVVDVTRQTRGLARRAVRDAGSVERARRSEQAQARDPGTAPASGWERAGRARTDGWSRGDRGSGRAARAANATQGADERPRGAEPRASEPRREPPPPRAEPRPTPREESRPQPRSEPPARPAEPRSEPSPKPPGRE